MRRLLCCCISLCALSCGGNQYGDHPPHPVSGQLLINGEPAEGATVRLFHLGTWGEKTIVPQATTGKDGRFNLSTYGMDDGAPVGEYQVEINWPAYEHGKNIGPNRLGRKFDDHKTSGVNVKIDADTKDLPITVTASILQVKEPTRQIPGGLEAKNRKN